MDNRPIGVFDSGLGGLTGVRELRKRLPHEEIIYFGDTGRVPYGSRSPETILQYARQDVAFLLSKNVKCIMAACGTVSSTYPAAEAAKLPVPYLGVVDAAAREAAFATRNRRIGVIGTAATIRSRSYEKLLRQLVPGVEITARACPLFVPLVEAGYVDHSEESRQQVTKLVIAQYLTEVREAGVDNFLILWYNSRKAAIVHGPYRCTIRRFAPVVQWPKSREKSERTATRPEPAAKTAAPLCFCGTAGSVSPRRFAPMPPALGRKLPKMVFQIHTPKGPFRI